MLVNPIIKRDALFETILVAIGQDGDNEMVQDGIIVCKHHSFGNQIHSPHNDYPEFDNDYEFSPYGVCDNIEQVLSKYKKFFDDPIKKYCVSFTKVKKSEQSERYGWRWHKWGDYIGEKNPQHEYLYDEDDSIQEVFCFHVYEILN